ncbi:hypothetical protein BH11BAC6_BH11BAC6_10010 [soil metagenome]
MLKVLLYFFLAFISLQVSAQEKDLGYFIDAGKQNSPLLKDIYYQTQINAIDSLRLLAGYKVQVNGIGTNAYAPVIAGYGYDAAISNIGNFSDIIQATKQLAGKKNMQNQVAAIRLLTDSLHIAGKISEQDLKKTIITQYITAYGSWQQYAFNNEVYNLLSKEDTLLKKLTQASVYRQTDYLTFLVTLQQQHLSVTQARNQFQNDYATLNYLCGLFDTSLTALAAPSIELNVIPELQSTVYYQKFRTDSLLLKTNEAQIDFAYKPKVNLYADAGYVSSFQYQAYKNFGASVGVNLTVPIYDGRQRKMQHDKVAIAERTRQGYRDFFITQYYQQIAQLTQQLNSSEELINETNNQLKYIETLIDANRQLLSTGDVRIADYIIAINNYLNAKNIIRQNTTNKLQIISQINYWNTK